MSLVEPADITHDDLELVERLREVAYDECGGWDPISNMLGIDPEDDAEKASVDYLSTLCELMRKLVTLCGDQEKRSGGCCTAHPSSPQSARLLGLILSKASSGLWQLCSTG